MKYLKKVIATAGAAVTATTIMMAATLPASAATQRPGGQKNYE